MFGLRRTPDAALRSILAREAERPWPYDEVGASDPKRAPFDAALSPRYRIDRNRFELEVPASAFARAREALFAWRHFEIPWLELRGAEGPVHPGQCVATEVQRFGVWSLNPCRVVYTIDEPDFAAYAYGTTPGHPARGEEHFVLRTDTQRSHLVLEIAAFSRPEHWLVRIGQPVLRSFQRRFAPACAEALTRALREA